MILENVYELSNIEIHEYCLLNTKTGKKIFYDKKSNPYFTGLYFRRNNIFFAIFPTLLGPKIYYNGEVYLIKKNLVISFKKNDRKREFCICDYNIIIKYRESPYIDIDVWSEEIDVDLFYMIEKLYKTDEFYKKFTLIQN